MACAPCHTPLRRSAARAVNRAATRNNGSALPAGVMLRSPRPTPAGRRLRAAIGLVQHLGEVLHLDLGGARALEAGGELDHAAGVGGDDDLRPGVAHVADL